MNMIPIGSRQIAYVQYDDQSSNMIVHYHTGFTASYANINKTDYQRIETATNRYDFLMKLTGMQAEKCRTPS